MLLSEFIKNGIRLLSSDLYPEEEARSMMMYYCSEVFGFPVYQHITEPSTEIPEELREKAMDDLAHMLMSEPLQYVLGYTEFCGRTFTVDERALIPRAETEVLCQKAEEMVKSAHGSLRILDLCTGSGCIAWTLALDLPGSVVVATDLSEDALELARSQYRRFRRNVVRPLFIKADVLDIDSTVAAIGSGADGEPLKVDLLTANPPYVMTSEKASMRSNVLAWEPHMAIFAPETDPLAFHKAIALTAMKVLKPGGNGIVEINSELPGETAAVFSAAGLADVKTVPDYFDRPRFVSFSRP